MFRGLTRFDQRLTIALIAVVSLGLVWRTQRQEKGFEASIAGPVVEHPAGVLETAPETAAGEPGAFSALREGRVDLNAADAGLLAEILPGIGPAKAEAMIQWRTDHGPFRRLEDLDGVPGIGPATIERIAAYVFIDPSLALPAKPDSPAAAPGAASLPVPSRPSDGLIDPNRATREELMTLDRIGEVYADRIIEERARAPFRSVDDLQRVKGIGPATIERNRHRLTIR